MTFAGEIFVNGLQEVHDMIHCTKKQGTVNADYFKCRTSRVLLGDQLARGICVRDEVYDLGMGSPAKVQKQRHQHARIYSKLKVENQGGGKCYQQDGGFLFTGFDNAPDMMDIN